MIKPIKKCAPDKRPSRSARKKMFVAYLWLAAGCSLTHSVTAQADLKPCDTEFMADYYREVDKIIDGSIEGLPQLALTAFPSFFPEYGVRLVNDDVYKIQLKSSFWDEILSANHHEHASVKPPKPETIKSSAKLDPQIAARTRQVYVKAISSAKPSNGGGLDGIGYRFSAPSVGCGSTWSPSPITLNGHLVELLQLLSDHSEQSSLQALQSSEQSITQLLDVIGHKQDAPK